MIQIDKFGNWLVMSHKSINLQLQYQQFLIFCYLGRVQFLLHVLLMIQFQKLNWQLVSYNSLQHLSLLDGCGQSIGVTFLLKKHSIQEVQKHQLQVLMLVQEVQVVVVVDKIFIKMTAVSKMMDFQITDKISRIKIFQEETEWMGIIKVMVQTEVLILKRLITS